ncbi:MAG: glutamate--tRNA ligase [Desulfarculaceae bacterium]|nr:glutamate--tRNA ligase [Desulfarculaceae bacterium]MCF8071204.1 glutamate--tRNA ligase [Desulfarculaceae bacterium]MCF8101193.1 glutamate--tRNA ligase [Desulfarculaceae bacterium]MCF8115258.1 glutamate--tRNA ligase [Desulfarculaceae bacterium]
MNQPTDNTPRVRTRFPPSPTGALHLGGARTALFNWLFARHHGGDFVLRLEDTDRKRSKQEHTDSIMAAMDWLGLDFDEGPFYQTQRLERYREAIDQMLEQGRAYWCHCSPEDLTKKREAAMKAGGKPMYDGACREKNLGPAEGAVVRFKGPRTGSTTFNDLVKGPITFEHKELDDLIILRSDGWPTYHLAVVVDDIDMAISHVIRGDDHVNNTPRQILLYQALDAAVPLFAHVPMILGPDKTKLSKRHGATAVVDYQTLGYLPEAMINALARLGWSHGDQEKFSLQELVELFGLDAVGRSAAVFDTDKLLHLNQRYIQEAEPARLAELLPPFLAERGITEYDQALLLACLPELTPRAKTLVELADWAEPFLKAEPEMSPKAVKKFLKPETSPVLERVLAMVQERGVEPEAMEAGVRELSEELGLKLGGIAQPVRVALTGRTFSPGIFEVMAILGAERVIARLKRALAIAKG